jgi:hypothetical protein
MKTIAPLQLNTLARTILFIFFVLSLLWGVANYVILREVLFHWILLVINGVLALVMGGLFYKNNLHTIFSYDQEGFQLKVGKDQASNRWHDFDRVSLFHKGLGDFTVRLYRNEEDFFEIPASALKLDPHEFRFEVIQLVKES